MVVQDFSLQMPSLTELFIPTGDTPLLAWKAELYTLYAKSTSNRRHRFHFSTFNNTEGILLSHYVVKDYPTEIYRQLNKTSKLPEHNKMRVAPCGCLEIKFQSCGIFLTHSVYQRYD